MNLFLAPMDGYTDCAYRIIVKKIFDENNFQDNIFFVTEFMSADGFFHNPTGVIKHILHTEIDLPLYAQIFGGNEDNLLHTAISLDKINSFHGIDINIGCPSPKIVKQGAGSGMLKDKKRTLDIIEKIRKNINKPLSIKTRIGLTQKDKNNQFDFIVRASEFCSLISIHGRTFNQGNSGEVDWNYIYELKSKINPNCKLIGNGGIMNYSDCKKLLGNLDGIMIGQGSFGNPRIFTEKRPNLLELKSTILDHLNLMLGFEIYYNKYFNYNQENFTNPNYETLINIAQKFNKEKKYLEKTLKTPIEFRKHLFCYIKGVHDSKELKKELIFVRDYYTLKEKIIKYFEFLEKKFGNLSI